MAKKNINQLKTIEDVVDMLDFVIERVTALEKDKPEDLAVNSVGARLSKLEKNFEILDLQVCKLQEQIAAVGAQFKEELQAETQARISADSVLGYIKNNTDFMMVETKVEKMYALLKSMQSTHLSNQLY